MWRAPSESEHLDGLMATDRIAEDIWRHLVVR
jgi:hypothetical protein